MMSTWQFDLLCEQTKRKDNNIYPVRCWVCGVGNVVVVDNMMLYDYVVVKMQSKAVVQHPRLEIKLVRDRR